MGSTKSVPENSIINETKNIPKDPRVKHHMLLPYITIPALVKIVDDYIIQKIVPDEHAQSVLKKIDFSNKEVKLLKNIHVCESLINTITNKCLIDLSKNISEIYFINLRYGLVLVDKMFVKRPIDVICIMYKTKGDAYVRYSKAGPFSETYDKKEIYFYDNYESMIRASVREFHTTDDEYKLNLTLE
jgi:hypothetical protein